MCDGKTEGSNEGLKVFLIMSIRRWGGGGGGGGSIAK